MTRLKAQQKWLFKAFFVLLIVFGVFLLFQTEDKKTETKETKLHKVVWVVDGDTIDVMINNKKETVRLIGIDTPEVAGPYTKEECFGQEASAYAKKLLIGQYVYLKEDKQGDNRDKYDRLLRYVYLADGTFIEAELLKNGFAYYYPYFPFDFKEQFRTWEEEAQDNKVGLWGKCENQNSN